MVTGFVSLWLAAALGQTAPEAAWLKSVPGDADVVVRIRNVDQVRDNIIKMVEATTPASAPQIKQSIETGFQQLMNEIGRDALQTNAPVILLVKLPKPEEMGAKPPPMALFVQSNNYAALQKSLAKAEPKTTHQPGGYDQVKGNNGETHYTLKGQGFVVASSDESLMRSIAKPFSTLDKLLKADLRKSLLTGDIGLYLNVASVQKQYGDQIEGARQALMTAMDTQVPGTSPEMMKAAKSMYGSMFDAIKDGQALVLNFEFSGAGLGIGGDVTAKPGTATAKTFTGPKTASGDALAKLPDDQTTYIYFNGSSDLIQRMQNMSMSMLSAPGEKPSPEIQKALDLQRQAGFLDMAVASGIAAKGGVHGVSFATYKDPQKAVDAMTAMVRAAKSSKAPLADMIKEVSVEPKAQTYKGFTLNHSKMQFDLSKFAKAQPNVPNTQNMMKALMGEAINTWYGSNGKQVLSVVAPDWAAARDLIDTAMSGQRGIGKTKSYQVVRAKLPKQINGLFLMSMQGIVQQMSVTLGSMMPDNPAVKNRPSMPKEPVVLGGSMTTTPGALQFDVFIPSAVGEVVEKGLLPLFQGMTGRVNQ